MQTTFDGWIMNPMVKANSVFTHRDMYKKLYTEKFDKILLREAGKIEYQLYIDNNNDKYYAHIAIPSEVVPKFYYDVVIEFFTKDNGIRASKYLTDYSVKFYSNDPAFVYTYLRVFKKNDMFLDDLSSKATKQALKEDPTIKNPNEVIMYVKSLYFAYLFMKSKNLFSKSLYTVYGEPYNQKKLVSKVRDASVVIEERKKKGEEIEKAKKIEKQSTNTISKPVSPDAYVNGGNLKSTSVTKRSVVSKVASVSTISNKTNKAKTIKTTKKI